MDVLVDDSARCTRILESVDDNASALITDAHTLLAAGSYGGARSLSVLAQEELGKALWIYEDFSFSWNEGDETPRVVDKLEQHGRNHTKKYLEAVVFGDDLAEFWGDYAGIRELAADLDSREEVHEQHQREAEVSAREANSAKQLGFYMSTWTRTALYCHRPRF